MGELRRLHKWELCDSYSIDSAVKCGMLRYTGHVAQMAQKDMLTEFWWGNTLTTQDICG